MNVKTYHCHNLFNFLNCFLFIVIIPVKKIQRAMKNWRNSFFAELIITQFNAMIAHMIGKWIRISSTSNWKRFYIGVILKVFYTKKSEIKKKQLTWISFGFEFMRFEADHGNSLQALFTQLTRIQICHIMTIEDIPKFLFEDA